MPPAGGKRTPLTQPGRAPIASYSWGGWGSQNDITQFRDVFQPDQGIFSPSYPLVPPEPERVRLWDFPVGYNTTYTPRSYEPVSFAELRALAESHDVTRLAIETRKDQIESSTGPSSPRRPNGQTRAAPHPTPASAPTASRASGIAPMASAPSRPGCAHCSKMCSC